MDDIEHLSRIARSTGLRIAVAESLTSGRLASTVGAGEGAGSWFVGGIVAYLRDVKERVLEIEKGVDLCSAECAEQLALGAASLFDADVCVSTTGVGGPDAEDGHPPGTVFLGWAVRGETGHRLLRIDDEPAAVLEATVAAALRMLVARAEELAAA